MAQPSVRDLPNGVEIRGAIATGYDEILTPDALSFVAKLHRAFESRRRECLQRRQDRQEAFDRGESLDFLTETKNIREGNWICAPIPRDLQDRRVEITGPTDRKMVINALNSGAKVFMADFEDANAPTWANMVEGQINLRDAIRRTITFTNPEGKEYRLNERTAVLFVRPRGRSKHMKSIVTQIGFRVAGLGIVPITTSCSRTTAREDHSERPQLTKLQFAVTNRRSGRYGNTSGVSPSRSFRCTLRQKSG